MNQRKFTIRRMDREEIDMAIDWAETEGWNPGNYDAECFYATDPNGFFLGLLDKEPIAMVSAVAYGEAYGFMGFYIVKPGYRNRGYGSEMVQVGLEYLENRTIGIDSLRPDLVSHRMPDFKPAHVNFRFRWIKDSEREMDPDVISLDQIPWHIFATYDHEVFAFARDNFLQCWISRPNTVALGVMRDNRLSGYGVIRECRDGFKIGPLFADGEDVAKSLFGALTKNLAIGVSIFLDTPQTNSSAIALAQGYDMTEVFRTTRMYQNKAPILPLKRWFGVTSFELG